MPSDLNYDGVVDGVDEAIYWEHLGTIDKSWHAGDFRGEGRLSFTARELGGTAPGVSPALPQTGFTAAGQLDIDNRFGYAGYIWDQHLGIYHVRHRAYDPFAGRWLQPDPLALMGPELLLALTSSDGSNLYAYVGNSPNGFVDPYGLWGEQTANDLYNNGSVWGRAAGAAVGIAGGHLEGMWNGAGGMARGGVAAGTEIGLIAYDLGRTVADPYGTDHRSNSQLFRTFDQGGTWGELYWDGVTTGGRFFASGASLGTYDLGEAVYIVATTGDTDAASEIAGGVLFGTALGAAGEFATGAKTTVRARAPGQGGTAGSGARVRVEIMKPKPKPQWRNADVLPENVAEMRGKQYRVPKLSDAELAKFQEIYGVEFSLTQGPDGFYYLTWGTHNSVYVPPGHKWIAHTHPPDPFSPGKSTGRPSTADIERLVERGQKSSRIITPDGKTHTFTVDTPPCDAPRP